MSRLVLLVSCFVLCTQLRAAVNAKIALELHRSEPYAIHLFHDGYYFTGQSRHTDEESHRIEIYDSKLSQKVATLPLVHTVESIQPLSATEVLVVGKHYGSEWRGYFSVISHNGKAFKAKTTVLNVEFMPEYFAGTAKKMYFNEAGNAGVFTLTAFGGKMLQPRLSGPGILAYTGEHLYVIERRNLLAYGDEGLTRISFPGEIASPTFEEGRNNISFLKWMSDLGLLAASETGGNLVHFVDPQTNKVRYTIATDSPRGLSQLGQCLVVASQETKQVSFYRARKDGAELVAKWELASIGGQLHNTRLVTVDPVAKRLFIRSVDLCPTCIQTRNVVVTAEESDPQALNGCY